MRLIVGLLAAGLAAAPGAGADKKPATEVASAKPIAASLAKAKALILFEGMPHPTFEAKLLARELQYRSRFRFNGHLFYHNRPRLADKDAAELKRLLSDTGNFTDWRGEKKCGGFHPDYMVQWKDGDDIYRVLICFGCHEVVAHGPKGAVRLDIKPAAYKELQAALKRYRVIRPKAAE